MASYIPRVCVCKEYYIIGLGLLLGRSWAGLSGTGTGLFTDSPGPGSTGYLEPFGAGHSKQNWTVYGQSGTRINGIS